MYLVCRPLSKASSFPGVVPQWRSSALSVEVGASWLAYSDINALYSGSLEGQTENNMSQVCPTQLLTNFHRITDCMTFLDLQ